MEVLDIPASAVGKLIGKAGETIRNLQLSTDTRIQVGTSVAPGGALGLLRAGWACHAAAGASMECLATGPPHEMGCVDWRPGACPAALSAAHPAPGLCLSALPAWAG